MEIMTNVWALIQQWYWVPLFVLYLGLISTILIENRNPTKTIAWVLVIAFLPLMGVVLYYLFGQKHKKEQRFKRSNQEQSRKLEEEFGQLEPRILDSLERIRSQIGELGRVYVYLKNEKISLPSTNNEVKLLHNGETKFEDLLTALRAATHSIHMEYFIFEVDRIGRQILELLEIKARAGVEVRLLVDAFGSAALVRHMRRRDSPVDFKVFLPVTFSSLANSNYRNHRKLAIIDGDTAYIGGINISDRYINPNPGQWYWRDTAVRIRGQSVSLLQIDFWLLWRQTGGDAFPLDGKYLRGSQTPQGQATVSFATSDPGSLAPHNMEVLLIGIAAARSSIQLCTPYYIPSEELETALMIAAASGVQVELLVPARGDSRIVQHASFSFLKPLLERGIKVYLYEKGFLHAKTVTIDNKLAYVGTVNLDTRSFYINYEISAIISETRFCQELDTQFQQDKKDSRLLTLKDWTERKPWEKGVDSLCRLLAPLL